ncbi:MAG: acylphosphatase [Candidatus Bathyarchaeia archaeon]|jgi:acylphosphatase
MISAHITVLGRVQGVGFRVNAKRRADHLGLNGWVKNLPDGSVEIIAEGPEVYIEEFIKWCRVGPSGAIVDKIDVERKPAKGELSGFQRN